MSFLCAVCGGTAAIELISYPSYPVFLVPLPQELARSVARAPLTLSACCACGHFQVADIDTEVQRLLYEEYYRYYEVDSMESMVPAYRQPFNRLVESLAADGALPNGRLLEIGCSSGAMVPFLTRFCREYTGVDPSQRIEIARAQFPAHQFIRAYFPTDELQGRFDVALSQFNLEHIANVRAFAGALAQVVREGGLLLVQVPDAGYFLRTSQPNFAAHEHVHYFRRAQLAMLLRACGFEPERWGDEGPSILCAARRTAAARSSPAIDHPLADAFVLRALAEDVPPLPQRPVLYGVGLTLHWLLAKRPGIARDVAVVDDNDGYEGRGVPGYDLPIAKPSPAMLRGRDVVLTLNAIYHPRVLERLQAMDGGMRVHRITEHGWITSNA